MSFTFQKLDQPQRKRGGIVQEVCCCDCQSVAGRGGFDPCRPGSVAEACASVNARFPLQRFYDIAFGESVRQTIIEYHTKDDEGE